MGLDTTHGAWHGPYSLFMSWRRKIAEVAGLPPLDLMEGFYEPIEKAQFIPTLYAGLVSEYSHNLKLLNELLPIRWKCLKPSALHELLYHSDCDGYLNWVVCGKIADELEKLLPKLEDNYLKLTKQFIEGCRLAFSKKERIKFH